MRRNFQFDPVRMIQWRGQLVDIHNEYDLESFGTDLGGNEASLKFIQNQYASDRSNLPAKVALRCTGNVKVAFNNLGAIAAPLNDEGIEIAYFDEDCDWLSFTDERIAQRHEPQGLHVSFINGFAVRIFCDEVTFSEE